MKLLLGSVISHCLFGALIGSILFGSISQILSHTILTTERVVTHKEGSNEHEGKNLQIITCLLPFSHRI